MSSRRSAGEDNILAMLERDSARRVGTRASSTRLAWYGAAAALTGILAGGVAWLAFDNHQTARELQAQYDAAAAIERAESGASVPPMRGAAGAAGAVAAVPDAPAAAVVDERPRMRTAPPPLVMLPAHEVPAKPSVRAPAVRQPDAVTSAANETKALAAPAPKTAPPRPAARPPEKRVAKVARAAPADARAPARRVLVSKARPAAAKTGTGSIAAADARKRQPGLTATATEQQVDSDVALISAIIAQSERHRGERGEREPAAGCSGAKCPPRPARP